MAPLDLVGKREADKGAGRAAVAKAHERREGFLELHDAGSGQIAPEGIGPGSGEGFQVRLHLGNIRRKQRELLRDPLPEPGGLSGVCLEVSQSELLCLVLKLELRIRAH